MNRTKNKMILGLLLLAFMDVSITYSKTGVTKWKGHGECSNVNMKNDSINISTDSHPNTITVAFGASRSDVI